MAASWMSALGHSLQSHSAPVQTNVRYASNSYHTRHGSELTRSANGGYARRGSSYQPVIYFINGYKWPRSLWRRRHPLEVGNILWRLVPRSPALRVDDSLRRKPIVLVETAHRYCLS